MAATHRVFSVGSSPVRIVNADEAGMFAHADISVEGANIRFMIDGNNPGVNTGHLLFQNQFYELEGGESIHQFRMAAPSGTATVRVSLRR